MIDNNSYPIPETQKKKYQDAVKYLMSKGIGIPPILFEKLVRKKE